MLQDVVYGHHVGAGQRSRKPEQVWNVHHVALEACEEIAESEIPTDRLGISEEWDGVEIPRQRPYFAHPFGRAHHEIGVIAINAAKCPNDVANISSDAEI